MYALKQRLITETISHTRCWLGGGVTETDYEITKHEVNMKCNIEKLWRTMHPFATYRLLLIQHSELQLAGEYLQWAEKERHLILHEICMMDTYSIQTHFS